MDTHCVVLVLFNGVSVPAAYSGWFISRFVWIFWSQRSEKPFFFSMWADLRFWVTHFVLCSKYSFSGVKVTSGWGCTFKWASRLSDSFGFSFDIRVCLPSQTYQSRAVCVLACLVTLFSIQVCVMMSLFVMTIYVFCFFECTVLYSTRLRVQCPSCIVFRLFPNDYFHQILIKNRSKARIEEKNWLY